MNSKLLAILSSLILPAVLIMAGLASPALSTDGKLPPFAGSKSCRECHARFYDLWSHSFHGLAMQPYSDDFAGAKLSPHSSDIIISADRYRAFIGKDEGYIRQTGKEGADTKFRIAYVLGGKNVYYFLANMDKGRLQTLPLGYDVKKREWFDMALSGVRHVPGQSAGTPVGWRDWRYTFNTSCYGCHVSQLDTGYNQQTDSYTTTWKEPGINCENCHGSSAQHIEAKRQLPKGSARKQTPDTTLVRTSKFTASQHNDACNSCHSRAIPLSSSYRSPERFFDNFDLVTLENPDFYPDGRDIGENYTHASWLMSPCVKSGKLHCVSCHTSSGRYRFSKPEDVNKACLPCHAGQVRNAAAHSRHTSGSAAPRCISCHMPATEFARIRRTDHSMRPPIPAATLAFGSPNACNGCHRERDAVWADKQVRQWHKRDYQEPFLKRAALVDAARKGEWSKSTDMLTAITDPNRDEITAVSLIRLMAQWDDPRKTPALRAAMNDRSPLVRGAAVQTLGYAADGEIVKDILSATGDEYRLVRIRAAEALSRFPVTSLRLPDALKAQVDRATNEYLAFIMVRPDQWASHYNMGNYLLSQGKDREALESYRQALKFEPGSVMALVNSSIVYARTKELDKAEESLRQALEIIPDHAAAHFNMGLVKAEKNDPVAAEFHLKKAIILDPQLDRAAYNLCVLVSKDRMDEALGWCRKAAGLKPQNPGYAYTQAFFLAAKGERDEAIRILKAVLKNNPGYKDAGLLLKKLDKKE